MDLLICRSLLLYKLLLNVLGSPGKPCLPGCPGRPGGPGNPGLPGINSPVPGKPGSPWKPWGPGAPLTPGRPGRPEKRRKVNSPYSINERYQGGNSRPFRTALKNSFYITNAWIQILGFFRIHKKGGSCCRPSNASFTPSLHYLFSAIPVTPSLHTEQSHPQHIPLYILRRGGRNFKHSTPDIVIPQVYHGSIFLGLLFLF